MNISINKVAESNISKVDFDNLPFGEIKADHMFVADFENGEWTNLKILPYGDICLDPAFIGIHYGQSIFEGMKAFRGKDGKVALFRPEENMKRLQRSAIRMGMEPVTDEVFMKGLKTLLEIDKAWVPEGQDKSLYIRPFQFATEDNLGVKISNKYKFIIFCLPTGKYFSKAVDVFVEEDYIRAARGGAGNAKAAGNYAPTLVPVKEIKEKGYDQILWSQVLDGTRYVQEIGVMNFFVRIGDTLVTPELDGTILEGITRKSIIKIAKDNGIKVEERMLSEKELFNEARNGNVLDCFGCGTAAVITQIQSIGNKNEQIQLPSVESREWSKLFYNELIAIRSGEKEDVNNWMMYI